MDPNPPNSPAPRAPKTLTMDDVDRIKATVEKASPDTLVLDSLNESPVPKPMGKADYDRAFAALERGDKSVAMEVLGFPADTVVRPPSKRRKADPAKKTKRKARRKAQRRNRKR